IEGDEGRALLTTTARTRIEFSGDQVGPASRAEEKELTVWVSRGRRVGRASNNDLVGRSIRQLSMLASDVALAAPEDPDFTPALPPQHYAEIPAFDEATAALDAAAQIQHVERVLARVRERGLHASGWLDIRAQDFAVGNSRGNFGFHRGTSVALS